MVCHTSTWISHRYIGVPHNSEPTFPSSSLSYPGLSQTDLWCSASYIELALVIYSTYGNIQVSVLFSHIIPPSPSPTESKSLYFTSVSLFLSCIYGHRYHKCINILYWCFFFWLPSLCIVGSSFIHLIRTDSTMFFFIAE